jgi:hypothetical protein
MGLPLSIIRSPMLANQSIHALPSDDYVMDAW